MSILTAQNEAAIKAVAEATGGTVDEFRLMVLVDKSLGAPAIGDPGYVAHMEQNGKDIRSQCKRYGVPLHVVDPSVTSEALA